MPLWFQARRYGWGWTPVTIQGWFVVVVFLAAIAADVVFLIYRTRTGADMGSAMVTFYLWLAVLIVALLAVCWLTGERPRWRWGN
jgi:hypothetical protein